MVGVFLCKEGDLYQYIFCVWLNMFNEENVIKVVDNSILGLQIWLIWDVGSYNIFVWVCLLFFFIRNKMEFQKDIDMYEK